jgi:hypothetical protein
MQAPEFARRRQARNLTVRNQRDLGRTNVCLCGKQKLVGSVLLVVLIDFDGLIERLMVYRNDASGWMPVARRARCIYKFLMDVWTGHDAVVMTHGDGWAPGLGINFHTDGQMARSSQMDPKNR